MFRAQVTKSIHLLRAAFALWLLLLAAHAAHAQQNSVKLERGWRFLADKEGAHKLSDLTQATGWRDVRVGLSWNAQFADLRDYMGVAWYRTTFDVPQSSDTARHVILRFGAVDYYSELFINGKRIGEHEGGYTPFEFDVTNDVKAGANELVVRVVDPPMDETENKARFPEMLYNEIPHGKQNWYVQTGGIWQAVTLEIRPEFYIKQVHLTPRVNGDFQLDLKLGGGSKNQADNLPGLRAGEIAKNNNGDFIRLEITITDPAGKSVYTRSLLTTISEEHTYRGHIASPQLWALDKPSLYTIKISASRVKTRSGLSSDFSDSHSVSERFGFRTFEARDGKLYLNGEPFYMIAALDQDFYPETIYTPPSEEFVRGEMLKGKRLGLNMLRCHIKVPDPVYLKVADEVGMLVWYEIPSWNDFHHFSQKAAERGERIFAEQVERDWNHPSIVIQSVINEAWGADLKDEAQRKWLRAAFERAKKMTAPLGRIITDNSACCDNFHVKSDLDDFHQYNSQPDYTETWDRWVADFASRPKFTFSPHGDAERTGREPLLVSEFGNWGLPRLPQDLPWWFPRDFGGREITRPAGVLERFKEFQFTRLFKDYNALAESSEWHQFISLKHEIEEMRRYPSIQGYVITEFTDLNWEANGLMDMWRNPKVYASELVKIQQPDVILARLPKTNYTSGERVEAETLISHYSKKELSGAHVRWSTDAGASGNFLIEKSISRASVAALSSITFNAPQVERPRRVRLRLEVRGTGGEVLAENSYELFIFPRAAATKNVSLIFRDPSNSNAGLMQALQVAGYKIPTGAGASTGQALMIATALDEQAEQHLRNGGRMVLLLNSKDALPATLSIKSAPRDGSEWDGNWITNFNWIRTDAAPFADVAFTPFLGFESETVVPKFVIQGLRAEDYGDVLSGITYGWLRNNAALAVQMRAGNGRIFATTFRFDRYGQDPYATRLLDSIISYADGASFAPKMNLR